jgi:hypothetical protein
MAEQPKQPKGKKDKIPTYEEIEKELGLEKMVFMSEMLRPDQHEEREEDPVLPRSQDADVLTPEHQRAIIEHIESDLGRKLTQQEINLALDQARSI